MGLRTRFKRLERQAADPRWDYQPRDVFTETEVHAAYLRGEGPGRRTYIARGGSTLKNGRAGNGPAVA
jgi:hypothetical protein